MSWKMRAALAASGLLVIAPFVACANDGGPAGGFEVDDGGGDETTTTTTGDSSTGPVVDPGPGPVTSDAASDAPIEVGPNGNPVGFPCGKAQDCVSGLCKAVLAGSGSSVCVSPCTAQTDCADNFFCDPATPGATTGFCAPRSPAHCKTCASNTECGSLSEVCGVADGDVTKACHVDCTIAGDAACPPDYACTTTILDGVSAKVCRPSGGLGCLDALGGFCDRVATPQTCSRSNVAGKCVGQRACLAASTRYDACGASAPVCKATCASTDPAGCTTSYCPAATDSASNCGTCGNVCPGLGKPKVNVSCAPPTCLFSCQGESYDVDNNKTTGCEVTDAVTGNHTANTPANVGDKACYDDSSDPNISGRIPSDAQAHENGAIAGFDAATGSAPDYHSIRAVGQSSIVNPCSNNIDLELKMAGSAFPGCYHLHVATNKNTYDCDTSAAGTCRINPGGNSLYDDDTTITVIVSKRNVAACAAATSRDNPTYTVKGHL
jgi:hypothetical protein